MWLTIIVTWQLRNYHVTYNYRDITTKKLPCDLQLSWHYNRETTRWLTILSWHFNWETAIWLTIIVTLQPRNYQVTYDYRDITTEKLPGDLRFYRDISTENLPYDLRLHRDMTTEKLKLWLTIKRQAKLFWNDIALCGILIQRILPLSQIRIILV